MRDPNALLAKEQDLEIYENQRYGEDPPAANEAILWQQNACTKFLENENQSALLTGLLNLRTNRRRIGTLIERLFGGRFCFQRRRRCKRTL